RSVKRATKGPLRSLGQAAEPRCVLSCEWKGFPSLRLATGNWELATERPMPDKFHHERISRGPQALARLASVPLTLCGAGARGSLLADNLARQGFRQWRVIDCDRVEEHNVGTQLYGEAEIGAWKVEALRSRLFRAVGVEIEAIPKELTARNARS